MEGARLDDNERPSIVKGRSWADSDGNCSGRLRAPRYRPCRPPADAGYVPATKLTVQLRSAQRFGQLDSGTGRSLTLRLDPSLGAGQLAMNRSTQAAAKFSAAISLERLRAWRRWPAPPEPDSR